MTNDYDPTDVAAQETDRAEAKERSRFERESEEDDIKWLMSSKTGRRIMWRLLEQSGVFRISFNQNSMITAFNEGQRNFGNKTWDLIQKVCPEQFPAMKKESTNV